MKKSLVMFMLLAMLSVFSCGCAKEKKFVGSKNTPGYNIDMQIYQSVDEIKDKYPKEFQDMIEKGYEYKYPNGESLIDSYNRVCIELDNIISNNDNRTILICSHGGTIRNIITYLISNSYKYHWNFKIDNGSVTILEVQDGFTVITAMNNTSFI